MKQKSIIALFLGAVLVLTLSSAEVAFADYDEEYEEEYEKEDHGKDYHDSEHDKEHESEHERGESERDDDDRYEKERRS